MVKQYRSEDGKHYFTFRFVRTPEEVEVYCVRHPSLQGQDPSPHRTHLFPSGRLCFVQGKAPQDQDRAEKLAKQWAEYFCEYRRTGVAQS